MWELCKLLHGFPTRRERKGVATVRLNIPKVGDAQQCTNSTYEMHRYQQFIDCIPRAFGLDREWDLSPIIFNADGAYLFRKFPVQGKMQVIQCGQFQKYPIRENTRSVSPSSSRRPREREQCSRCHRVRPPTVPNPPIDSKDTRSIYIHHCHFQMTFQNSRLNLNIFVPPEAILGKYRLLVIVWIHGGAFTYGDGTYEYRKLPIYNCCNED